MGFAKCSTHSAQGDVRSSRQQTVEFGRSKRFSVRVGDDDLPACVDPNPRLGHDQQRTLPFDPHLLVLAFCDHLVGQLLFPAHIDQDRPRLTSGFGGNSPRAWPIGAPVRKACSCAFIRSRQQKKRPFHRFLADQVWFKRRHRSAGERHIRRQIIGVRIVGPCRSWSLPGPAAGVQPIPSHAVIGLHMPGDNRP